MYEVEFIAADQPVFDNVSVTMRPVLQIMKPDLPGLPPGLLPNNTKMLNSVEEHRQPRTKVSSPSWEILTMQRDSHRLVTYVLFLMLLCNVRLTAHL